MRDSPERNNYLVQFPTANSLNEMWLGSFHWWSRIFSVAAAILCNYSGLDVVICTCMCHAILLLFVFCVLLFAWEWDDKCPVSNLFSDNRYLVIWRIGPIQMVSALGSGVDWAAARKERRTILSNQLRIVLNRKLLLARLHNTHNVGGSIVLLSGVCRRCL